MTNIIITAEINDFEKNANGRTYSYGKGYFTEFSFLKKFALILNVEKVIKQ